MKANVETSYQWAEYSMKLRDQFQSIGRYFKIQDSMSKRRTNYQNAEFYITAQDNTLRRISKRKVLYQSARQGTQMQNSTSKRRTNHLNAVWDYYLQC